MSMLSAQYNLIYRICECCIAVCFGHTVWPLSGKSWKCKM